MPMRITFSDYCLDLATRQLLRGRTEIRLSPKGFELLCFLVEHRTRAMSKTELHERLWPDTFVTDANLSVLVAELRAALHDRPGASRFIRTVRGFGYGFCGNVTDALAPPALRRLCWVVSNGREIALQEGDNIIGRDETAAVPLNLPSVSRRHARIVVSSHHAVVEDLGSKNGTFLGNDRITQAVRLSDLDELRVGSVRLLVRIMTADSRTETVQGT
jgi:DNA-binding winged helix-turn-helix (wHTH) protein